MLEFKNRYEKLQVLGEGTYGKVYKVKDVLTEKIYAIKKIKIDKDDEGIPSTAMREIAILKHLNH